MSIKDKVKIKEVHRSEVGNAAEESMLAKIRNEVKFKNSIPQLKEILFPEIKINK